MPAIGNVYGHGFGSCDASRLEALGFRIRPEVSKYMGAQVCRFIDFERGPCLELIQVEDDQAYLDFLPEGMVAYCPGISLTVSGTGAFKDYEREFRHLRPYTLHVNYDGSSGPAGPGWTYLNFGVPSCFALDAGGLKELSHLARAEVAGGGPERAGRGFPPDRDGPAGREPGLLLRPPGGDEGVLLHVAPGGAYSHEQAVLGSGCCRVGRPAASAQASQPGAAHR